jgi:hypothetical protein
MKRTKQRQQLNASTHYCWLQRPHHRSVLTCFTTISDIFRTDTAPNRAVASLAHITNLAHIWTFSSTYDEGLLSDIRQCNSSSLDNSFDGENLTGTQRKPCPSATLSTTSSTWTALGMNPGLRGEKPATNRLSYVTAKQRSCSVKWDGKIIMSD